MIPGEVSYFRLEAHIPWQSTNLSIVNMDLPNNAAYQIDNSVDSSLCYFLHGNYNLGHIRLLQVLNLLRGQLNLQTSDGLINTLDAAQSHNGLFTRLA